MDIKFFYIYVLFSLKDRKLYIGYTENFDNRVNEHYNGKVRSTKSRRPLILIYFEAFKIKKDAKIREIFLKSGFGRNQLKKSLQNTLKNLDYSYL